MSFDKIYADLVLAIKEKGILQNPDEVRAHYEDGEPAPAYAIEGVSFKITPDMGLPILKSKFVGSKWAFTELEWIWQAMSNDVKWLQERGVTIWDSWTVPANYYTDERDIVFVDKKNTTTVYGEPQVNGTLVSREPLDKKLAKHWKSMMTRVYAKSGRKARFYRNRGVQVHPDWWDVNNFVKDVKNLPNFCYKLTDWNNFVLDKDYYGDAIYSKDTCIWLPQAENVLYQESVYPIEVTDSNGNSTTFLGIRAVSDKLGIPTSTVHRFINKGEKLNGCKGNNRRFNGYVFKSIPVPEDKLARLSLLEGTLGKAYGFQLSHRKIKVNGVLLNQVEYVLHQLKNNPSSRRIMTSLWDVDDLDNMALQPCVWATHWTVQGGKLNLHVKQRSGDVCLGLPFNVLQYHALHVVMAKVSDLELGTMFWNIDNAHIYDRHMERAVEQVTAPMTEEVLKAEPKLVLPWEEADMTNFFECPLSELKVEGYKHNGRFNYEVAI